jgi:dihydrolipoamide dehydrogenase
MADPKKFDVVIIGGGPGGYVTAIRSAQLGLSTAVVESTHLGGICLNWGCIPTKALLRSAEVYRTMQHAAEFGLSASDIKFDLKKVVERSRGVSAQLAAGVKHLLKKNKVTVLEGRGKLAGNGKVIVDGKDAGTVEAKHIIIATGARARNLPGLEADGKLVWSYREAMVPESMPKSSAGHRLWRYRYRVCQLLSHPWR